MADAKSKILIVEDDLDVAEMLNAYFRVQGYEVFTVNWGEDGVRAAQTVLPDLIILDIRLPDIDGYEVARRVRTDRRTNEIPIIFLTEKRERIDRLQGFEVGADDYITKPFDVQELRLRVRNALRRAGSQNNAVTGLPGKKLCNDRLSLLLERDDWASLAVIITDLEMFNEIYGFVARDDVLRAVALILTSIVEELGSIDDFVGHPNESHFLIVTTPAKADELVRQIQERLGQAMAYFYPIHDRETGYVEWGGEQLRRTKVPFMEIATRVVRAGDASLEDVADLRRALFPAVKE